jgi:hypothetical protein
VRLEVPVETSLTFHTRRGPFPLSDLPRPETVTIEFEGRRFVWHAIEPDEDGTEYWPTVTTMLAEGEDGNGATQELQRFLSALAFKYGASIEPLWYGGAGFRAEMDTAFARQPRRGLAGHLHSAPVEVIVEDDDRLRVCLGHFRDALNTSSPFFRFLAFWNALDVACDDSPGGHQAWVIAHASDYWDEENDENPRPADVWEYLRESSRNAVAHAVRDPGRPEVNPDDPGDRNRLTRDAALIQRLVQHRVRERWGDYAVTGRPRP